MLITNRTRILSDQSIYLIARSHKVLKCNVLRKVIHCNLKEHKLCKDRNITGSYMYVVVHGLMLYRYYKRNYF